MGMTILKDGEEGAENVVDSDAKLLLPLPLPQPIFTQEGKEDAPVLMREEAEV
jgi:hypothetical protein